MYRRILVVILIVVAVGAIGTAIGFGAYHAGHHDALVNSGNLAPAGQDGRYWYGYPGFGFFPWFFPFSLVAVLVILLIASRRRHWGPWGHPGAWGAWGAGPGTCGSSASHAIFDEWHRQAHMGQSQSPSPETAAGPQSTSGDA